MAKGGGKSGPGRGSCNPKSWVQGDRQQDCRKTGVTGAQHAGACEEGTATEEDTGAQPRSVGIATSC